MPIEVADRTAKRLLEDRPRRLSTVVRQQADAGDYEVFDQRAIRACYVQRSLERPNGSLSIWCWTSLPNRFKQRRRIEVVPIHAGSVPRFAVCVLGTRPVHRTFYEKEVLMQSTDVWTYRDKALGSTTTGTDVVGYGVEALDGSIGKIDEATYDAGTSYIVVDTGPWIFGKKVMLPAGIIRSADHDEEKVFVNRTKDQIKDAPEFDDSLIGDEGYRTQLGSYYGEGGAGHRDWDDTR